MAKGKTLWEMLMAKLQGPVELHYYNPLKAKIGSSIMINEIDLRDYNFFIKEIRQYQRWIDGQQFLFVDYVLLARPLHGDDVWLRLRLNPVDDPEAAAGLTHTALLLRLYDEMAYDDGLYKVVTDTTKLFQVIENGQVTEEYGRINNVTTSYKAKLSILKDENKDGQVDEGEVKKENLEYWDYWRDTTDPVGQPVRQYLFVEMNSDSGWFQIWRGQEIDPQKVLVI
ncbi:MAG TPA: hypothetical protein VKU02_01890 [Gemmataceae bacterium]|nr:hypothetical protein [Gemmataceae bacterium]